MSTISWPPATDATELVDATALPPNSDISSTTLWAGPVSFPLPSKLAPTSFTTIFAPNFANSKAMPLPIPLPDPVTIATFPSRGFWDSLFFSPKPNSNPLPSKSKSSCLNLPLERGLNKVTFLLSSIKWSMVPPCTWNIWELIWAE